MGLSLPAETLLLSIDPGDGGLLIKRRRAREAVRAAATVEGGRGSLRRATRELADAGLVEVRGLRRRLRLTDRAAPARRFNAIKRASMSGEFPAERDQQLFVLLAGSGVLARRMNRDERRRARRRLSALLPEPNAPIAGLAPGLLALAILADAGFGEFEGGSDFASGDLGSVTSGDVDVSQVGFGGDGGGGQ